MKLRLVDNPPNPWRQAEIDWEGEPPQVAFEVHESDARSILSKNDSPDLDFRWSLNPYQGCYHGCAYCYARPTHQYLDWGAGTDFERRIVVKRNAAALLRKAFASRTWKGEVVVFSGNTDCYQPLEGSYGITRACLEVCKEHRNPLVIITKGAVIRRDLPLLSELSKLTRVRVFLSIPFASDKDARLLEPFASPSSRRFETLRMLRDQGVETGISLSPLIPGINDADIPELLRRAGEAGVRYAFMTLLRLPREVAPVFEGRLRQSYPNRADKVMNELRRMRQGRTNDARFGWRMHGSGERWKLSCQVLDRFAKRYGIQTRMEERIVGEMDAPEAASSPQRQLSLW